eukprot:PhF_6_TR10827/c1_g2_i2/m.17469
MHYEEPRHADPDSQYDIRYAQSSEHSERYKEWLRNVYRDPNEHHCDPHQHCHHHHEERGQSTDHTHAVPCLTEEEFSKLIDRLCPSKAVLAAKQAKLLSEQKKNAKHSKQHPPPFCTFKPTITPLAKEASAMFMLPKKQPRPIPDAQRLKESKCTFQPNHKKAVVMTEEERHQMSLRLYKAKVGPNKGGGGGGGGLTKTECTFTPRTSSSQQQKRVYSPEQIQRSVQRLSSLSPSRNATDAPPPSTTSAAAQQRNNSSQCTFKPRVSSLAARKPTRTGREASERLFSQSPSRLHDSQPPPPTTSSPPRKRDQNGECTFQPKVNQTRQWGSSVRNKPVFYRLSQSVKREEDKKVRNIGGAVTNPMDLEEVDPSDFFEELPPPPHGMGADTVLRIQSWDSSSSVESITL